MFPQSTNQFKGNPRELRAQNAQIARRMEEMLSAAEAESRDFNPAEQVEWDLLQTQSAQIMNQVRRLEMIPPELLKMTVNGSGPNYLRYGRGDDESRAFSAFILRNDRGALKGTPLEDPEGAVIYLPRYEKRATDEVLDLTDGASTVPTGLANMIAARRNEIDLAYRLGLRQVPGSGTTVNFAYENADPNVLATTSEQDDAHAQSYERDQPTIATKAFTLTKKTKKIEISEELEIDEQAQLMNFVSDHIGRAIALTHNAALLSEVGSYGTQLDEFAGATSIAAGEVENLVYHDTLAYYLDDGASCSWIMKPSTYGAIKKLTGNSRLYEAQVLGSKGSLLEYPVYHSASAGSMTASSKSVFFGNWYYVGMREDPAIKLIRDPYSVDGLIILKWSCRFAFGVLIAGACGYGQHPTS